MTRTDHFPVKKTLFETTTYLFIDKFHHCQVITLVMMHDDVRACPQTAIAVLRSCQTLIRVNYHIDVIIITHNSIPD